MKLSVVKGVVWSAIFVVSLFIFGIFTNRGNMDMTAKMEDATLPLVYLDVAGRKVNCLAGYKEPMETAYVQDCITPLSIDRTLDFTVVESGVAVEKLEYELRSIDGQRLIENGAVENTLREETEVVASLKFKDLLEDETEYMLILVATTEEGDTLHYYSKIIICENEYIAESIDFVIDFHNKTFNKEQAGGLTKYLESNSSADNSDFYSVNIHSSFDQITWGNLEVKEEMVPTVTLSEVNGAISSYKLDFVVSNTEEKTTNLYRVSEYFRVRHTDTRMYLLDYERNMEKIFEPTEESYDSTKIILGIGAKDIELSESYDGKNIAFVTADRLFAFNINDEKMSLLFSFYDPNNLEISEINDKHDIKILNVDETGNITFMVYGYMNRGVHEGKVGVTVYTYNSLSSVVSEQVYIPYGKSYEVLKRDIEKLSYINRNNKLYLSLEKAIYEINIMEKTYDVLATELETGEYKISDTGRMVVWQDSVKNDYSSKKLYLMDLSTEEIMGIEAEKDERIKALGFVGEDLVYGLAYEDDIVVNENDETIFYMHSVMIQNETGLLLKQYHQDNVYVKQALIDKDMIHLARATKSVDEDVVTFTNITDDQIVSAKEGRSGENFVETGYSNLYKTFVRIVIDGKITPEDVHYVEPEQELYEGDKLLSIMYENEEERFYVYNAKELLGIYDKENEAVQYAVANNAWVINDYGSYVWRKESRSNKNQIMAIKETNVTEDKTSLGVCLDTMLAFEGIMRNASYILERGKSATEILSENLENVQVLELKGCSLDDVLYYINKDIPVLVRMGQKKAILITGFNDSEVVILNPDEGTLSKMKKNQAEKMFEEAGSYYITYVPLG